MSRGLSTFFLVLLASGLAACGGSREPQVASNPNARMADVEISIEGVPGPFDTANATANYAVDNVACAPAQPISGAQLAPQRKIPVELRKVSGTRFEGSMLLNPFIDQDYYGLGPCHWVVAGLTVTVKQGRKTFDVILPGKEAERKETFATYFPKSGYSDAGSTRVFGVHNLSRFANPDDAFSITVKAKEATK
jgi:hypothetical protein